MIRMRLLPVYLRLWALLVLLAAWPAFATDALSNYVYSVDNHFSWKRLSRTNTDAVIINHLQLVSQKWRDSVWDHHVQIVRPAKVRHPEMAFLFVTGSGNGTRQLFYLKRIAERAG